MRCRLTRTILRASVVQVHAQELSTTHAINVQDSVESLVKTLVRKVRRWTMHHTDLETTVFAKPSHLEIPSTTNVSNMLECSEPRLGLVNRMHCNLLDGSLKGVELRTLNFKISQLGKSGRWREAFEVFKAIRRGALSSLFCFARII